MLWWFINKKGHSGCKKNLSQTYWQHPDRNTSIFNIFLYSVTGSERDVKIYNNNLGVRSASSDKVTTVNTMLHVTTCVVWPGIRGIWGNNVIKDYINIFPQKWLCIKKAKERFWFYDVDFKQSFIIICSQCELCKSNFSGQHELVQTDVPVLFFINAHFKLIIT